MFHLAATQLIYIVNRSALVNFRPVHSNVSSSRHRTVSVATRFVVRCEAEDVWHVSSSILGLLTCAWAAPVGYCCYQAANFLLSLLMALCSLAYRSGPIRLRAKTRYAAEGIVIGGRRISRRRPAYRPRRIVLRAARPCGFQGLARRMTFIAFGCSLLGAAALIFYKVRRIGEADNPGPVPGESARPASSIDGLDPPTAHIATALPWTSNSRSGGLVYPRPHREGFRGAMAPGYPDPEPGRASKARCHLQLRIESANTTGWGPLRRRLDETSAHALVAQETWVLQSHVAEASTWARKRGWTSIWAPACVGPGGGASGGVAIFVRKDFGLREPSCGSHIVVEGRAVLGVMDAPGHRPIALASVYLVDGEGITGTNCAILNRVGKAICAQGAELQVVIGGDFQNCPSAVNEHGLPGVIGGKVVAADTARGTFRGPRGSSVIDFFVISHGLVTALADVHLVEGTGIKGHVPICIRFKPNPVSLQTLVVRQPIKNTVDRVFGPLQPDDDWSEVREATGTCLRAALGGEPRETVQAKLDAAFEAWAELAKEELARATGTPIHDWVDLGKRPRIAWKSVLREVKPNGEASTVSVVTWLKGIVSECRRMAGLLEQRAGAGFYVSNHMQNPNLPHGCTFAVPVRGGYDEPRAEPREGGRPRPPLCAEQCVAALREILADMTTNIHKVRTDDRLQEWFVRVTTLVCSAITATDLANNSGCLHDPALCRKADELLKELRDAEREGEERRDKANKDKWVRWLEEDWDRGASNAHKATKEDVEWKAAVAKKSDGTVSSDPFSVLDALRRKYQDLWDAKDEPHEYAWKDVPPPLPTLTPAQLRDASGSFCVKTASTYDGLHVRHYRLLGDGALQALGEILATVEAAGTWPSQSQLAILAMIGKKQSGYRGIGKLPSLYRLWAKARREYAVRWESQHRRPFLAATSGVGPTDAVYRLAMRQEAATAEGREAVTVLDDLQSFYETIDRCKLMEEGIRLGFPVGILRASLAAYAGPRMMTLEGLTARELYAEQGIIAGCAMATTYVQIFYLHKLDAAAKAMPDNSDFDIYIDDVVTSAEGPRDSVSGTIEAARNILMEALVGDRGCRIAADKTRVVATSAKVARQVTKRIGIDHAVARAAPSLGIDITAGGKRTALGQTGAMRKSRMSKGKSRRAKLRKVAKVLGGKVIRIYTAGIAPECNYGAEVWGITDAESLKLRRIAAVGLKPFSKCRSLTMTHLINDLPTIRDELRPIVHYSKVIWRAIVDRETAAMRGMSLVDVRRYWQSAHEAIQPHVDRYAEAKVKGGGVVRNGDAKRAWDAVRGPVSAAAMSLARLGWRFDSALTLRDAHGDEVQLTTTSPAMLKKMLTEAAQDDVERRLGTNWAASDGNFTGRRVCADLAVKVLKHGHREGMTPLQLGALRAAVCRGVYTRSRAVADGYDVENVCSKCGAEGDTPHHRVFCCPCTKDEVLRAIPSWLYEEGRKADPCDLFWTTAVFPHPADDWPRPPAECTLVWEDGDGVSDEEHEDEADPPVTTSTAVACSSDVALGRKFGGNIYSDGSATLHDIRGLGRAGCGSARVDRSGNVIRAFTVAVPRHLPQSSQAAEHLGVACSRRAINMRATIKSDCLNVVRSANATGRTALGPSRLYAGIALDKWTMADRDKLIEAISWVKAHRTSTGNEDEATALDIRGNAAADRLAAEAVGNHDQPSAEQKDRLLFFTSRAPLVAKAIGVALATFPAKEDRRLRRVPRPTSMEEARRLDLHWWTFQEDRWRCTACGKWSTGEHLGPKLRSEKCGGHMAESKASMWHSLGHRIRVAGGAYTFAYCSRCGAWGSRRSHKLQLRCVGPTAAGAAALKRIARGLHPWRKKLAGGGEAPRSSISVKAEYVAEKNAWAGLGPAADSQSAVLGNCADPGTDDRNLHRGTSTTDDSHVIDGRPRSPGAVPILDDLSFTEGDMCSEDPFGHGGGLDEESGGLATVHDVPPQGYRRHSDPCIGENGDMCSDGQLSLGLARSPQPEHGDKGHEVPPPASGPAEHDDDRNCRNSKRHRTCRDPFTVTGGGGARTGHRDLDEPRGHAWCTPASGGAVAVAGGTVGSYPGTSSASNEASLGIGATDNKVSSGNKGTHVGGGLRPTPRGAKERLEALRQRVLANLVRDDLTVSQGQRGQSSKDSGTRTMSQPAGFADPRCSAAHLGTSEDEGETCGEVLTCSPSTGDGMVNATTASSSQNEDAPGSFISQDLDLSSSANWKEENRGDTPMSGGAKAVDARASVDIAREGPGGPPPYHVTGSVTSHPGVDVAEPVVGGGVVAIFHLDHHARDVEDYRGKATCGPPCGAAAPQDGTKDTDGIPWGQDCAASSQELPYTERGGRPPKRRRENSPLNAPENLGAGPSDGRLLREDQGGRPAEWVYARRRVGDVDPTSLASAACGSGGAAVQGRWEELVTSSGRLSVQNARKPECSHIGKSGVKGSTAGPEGDTAAAEVTKPAEERWPLNLGDDEGDWESQASPRREMQKKTDGLSAEDHTEYSSPPRRAALAADFDEGATADCPSDETKRRTDSVAQWDGSEAATRLVGRGCGQRCEPHPPPHHVHTRRRSRLELTGMSQQRDAETSCVPAAHGHPYERHLRADRNGPEGRGGLVSQVTHVHRSGEGGTLSAAQKRPSPPAMGPADPGGGHRPKKHREQGITPNADQLGDQRTSRETAAPVQLTSRKDLLRRLVGSRDSIASACDSVTNGSRDKEENLQRGRRRDDGKSPRRDRKGQLSSSSSASAPRASAGAAGASRWHWRRYGDEEDPSSARRKLAQSLLARGQGTRNDNTLQPPQSGGTVGEENCADVQGAMVGCMLSSPDGGQQGHPAEHWECTAVATEPHEYENPLKNNTRKRAKAPAPAGSSRLAKAARNGSTDHGPYDDQQLTQDAHHCSDGFGIGAGTDLIANGGTGIIMGMDGIDYCIEQHRKGGTDLEGAMNTNGMGSVDAPPAEGDEGDHTGICDSEKEPAPTTNPSSDVRRAPRSLCVNPGRWGHLGLRPTRSDQYDRVDQLQDLRRREGAFPPGGPALDEFGRTTAGGTLPSSDVRATHRPLCVYSGWSKGVCTDVGTDLLAHVDEPAGEAGRELRGECGLERAGGHRRVRAADDHVHTAIHRELLGSDVVVAASPTCVESEWSESGRLPGSDVRYPIPRGLCVNPRSSGERTADDDGASVHSGERRSEATLPRGCADEPRVLPLGAYRHLGTGRDGDDDHRQVTLDYVTWMQQQQRPHLLQKDPQGLALGPPPGDDRAEGGSRGGHGPAPAERHERARATGAPGGDEAGHKLLGSDVVAAAGPTCVNTEWSRDGQLPGSDVRRPTIGCLCVEPRLSGKRGLDDVSTSDHLDERHVVAPGPLRRDGSLRGAPRGDGDDLRIGSEGDVDDHAAALGCGTRRYQQPQPHQQQRKRQEPSSSHPSGEYQVAGRGLREGRGRGQADGHGRADRARDAGAAEGTETGRKLLGSDVVAAASPTCVDSEWSELECRVGRDASGQKPHLHESIQRNRQLPGSDVRHPATKGLCVQTRWSGEAAEGHRDIAGSLEKRRSAVAYLRQGTEIHHGDPRGDAVDSEVGSGSDGDTYEHLLTHTYASLGHRQAQMARRQRQRQAHGAIHRPGETMASARDSDQVHEEGYNHYLDDTAGDGTAVQMDAAEGRRHRTTWDEADLRRQAATQTADAGDFGEAACRLSSASTAIAATGRGVVVGEHCAALVAAAEEVCGFGDDGMGIVELERAEAQHHDRGGGGGLGAGISGSTSAGCDSGRWASVSANGGAARGGARPQHQAAG